MGYAESLLAHGEVIAVRGRQHWLATFVDGRRAWAVFVAAILILLLGTRLEGEPQRYLGYLGYAVLVIALLWLAVRYWDWMNQEYLVTTRRVIKVEGIVNKRSADSSLEKINDAVLDQNLIGRIFGYADLDILTAADQAIDKFRMLNHALAFKRAMLEKKHDLEMELSRAPGPEPLTREGTDRAPGTMTAGDNGGPAPAVSPSVSADEREMSPEEITKTLDSLADLRERGVISRAEFEAKKADLLGRL